MMFQSYALFPHMNVIENVGYGLRMSGVRKNEAAARAETMLGIEFASDTRGSHPFMPVASDGAAIGPPQFPTTLPTLDELIGIDDITVDNVHLQLLALTERTTQDQVYTLHAELEGMKLRPVFERLIAGWRAQGHTLVALGALHDDQIGRASCRERV